MSIIGAAEFFSKSLIPTIGAGGGSARRVPFTFTSTQRLLGSGAGGVIVDPELIRLTRKESLDKQLAALEGSNAINSVAGTAGLSSALSATNLLPVISMMVNPNSIKWSQPKRHVKRDTMEGSVFYHFTDSNGQNNDILTLQFSGNTGYITSPSSNFGIDPFLSSTETGSTIKLKVWHELYKLSREPVLLNGRIKNDVFITYSTVLMPMPITFIGFFNQTLDFTENAAQPFSRDYSFGFTVTNTSPSLDTLVDKLNSALTEVNIVSTARVIGQF